MNNEPILVVSGKVVKQNSRVDWPDLNYPGAGLTILRTIHSIDYDSMKVQLDGSTGPWFYKDNLPEGVGFYKRVDGKL